MRPIRTAITFLSLLFLAVPTAVAMDLRPYAGQDAPLFHDDIVRRHKLWAHVSAEAYQARGSKDPRFDADMIRLLDATAAVVAGDEPTMPNTEAVQLAKRLTGKDGSPDPLAAWALFTLLDHTGGDWKAVNKACDKARAALSGDPALPDGSRRYAALLLVYPHAHCLETWGRPEKPDGRKTPISIASELAGVLTAVINGHECDAAPTTLIRISRNINLHHQDFGEPVVQAVDAALDAAKTEPWLANTVKAGIRISNAWAWRGSGWANTVTEEGWKGFSRNLSEANTYLAEAYRLNPKEPMIGNIGITLANAGDSTIEPREWFRRSVAACFDCMDPYHTARNFQRPRWGGSYIAMLYLGCDCVDTRRFDTAVPSNLLACIADVIGDAHQMDAKPAMQRALADPRVATALDALIAGTISIKPALSVEYAWIKTAYLWHAGQREAAKALAATLPAGSLPRRLAGRFNIDAATILAGATPSPGPATRSAPTDDF